MGKICMQAFGDSDFANTTCGYKTSNVSAESSHSGNFWYEALDARGVRMVFMRKFTNRSRQAWPLCVDV